MIDTDMLRTIARHCELEYGVQLILDAADELDAWVKDWNTATKFLTERCCDCGVPLLDFETGPRCFQHAIKQRDHARAMDALCTEINEEMRRIEDDQG